MQADDLDRWGVLLSGPNGVGKSAISLLTFLLCFSRGLPVCYIPTADGWIRRAKTDELAAEYFMTRFFMQNADIIADDETLRPFFQEQLDGHPADPQQYLAFSDALESSRTKTPCGFIIDEVQRLTPVRNIEGPDPSTGKIVVQPVAIWTPFKEDFTVWTGPSSYFRSLLCASVYGMREFELPSGEAHRLRFVQALAEDDVIALVSSPLSPLYRGEVFKTFAGQVYSLTGGMSRLLYQLLARVPMGVASEAEIKAILARFEDDMVFELLTISNDHWITTIPKAALKKTMRSMLELLRAQTSLSDTNKQLYDYGLLLNDPVVGRVHVSSAIATSVLFQLYSNYICSEDGEKLSDFRAGAERGYCFERQVLAFLSIAGSYILKAKWFKAANDKSHDRDISIHVTRIKAFSDIADIARDDRHGILWINTSDRYLCDGIIVPSAEGALYAQPVIVLDTSVTNPFEYGRKLKVESVHSKVICPLVTHLKCKEDSVIGMYFYDQMVEAPATVPESKLATTVQATIVKAAVTSVSDTAPMEANLDGTAGSVDGLPSGETATATAVKETVPMMMTDPYLNAYIIDMRECQKLGVRY
jgi:hypothetical protein